MAESWLYENGVLFYFQEDRLRILDLHRSATHETVIDVPLLLDSAVSALHSIRKYTVRALHHAKGIVSCLYTQWPDDFSPAQSYLIIFNIHQPNIILTAPHMTSTNKIFVRNDEDYLYVGTHSFFIEDNTRRWVLKGYDIKANQWFPGQLPLVDMLGWHIGQEVVFDIIDGYFYCLSNRDRNYDDEDEDLEFTSYYHCCKFPVSRPEYKYIQKSDKDRMWRRYHDDGPLDDRWAFLRLLKNEQHGTLQILESRKEWFGAAKSLTHTAYYTTDLHFSIVEKGNRADLEDAPAGDTVPPGSRRLRDPNHIHVGEDLSKASKFGIKQRFIRSYYPSSQTFVDLVDNPCSSAPEIPRLQLRAGSRELPPYLEVPPSSPTHDEHLEHLYGQNGANKIDFWPPARHEAHEVGADVDALDRLNMIVNPPSHVGRVKGTWDDRSFVYSIGNNPPGMHALVLLNFDPAIRLPSLPAWGQPPQPADSCGPRPFASDDADSMRGDRAAPEHWARREPAMYSQIGFGLNDLPDFSARRRQVEAHLS